MPVPLDQVPDWFAKVETAIASYPKAAMFELAERGHYSLFEQLVACLISIRTLDESTIPIALRLFEQARTPQAMLALSFNDLLPLLHGTQYPAQKAAAMHALADFAMAQGGELPDDYAQLLTVKGVGPKCAKLALGIAAGVRGVSVDVHVHRVVKRWPLVRTHTPEETMDALEALLPPRLWIDVNRLLMPFGKHICQAVPKCSICPLNDVCEKVSVVESK